jgi:hypothetical protein
MWKSQVEVLNKDRVQRYLVEQLGKPISYGDVLLGWQSDEGFREFFTQLLTDAPFAAYRWETPPLTQATIQRDFQFVLLRSDALDREVDERAFAAYFSAANDVVTFANLSGDAVLVVPCPVVGKHAYGHLAAFMRGAPPAQLHHFWQAVGNAMSNQLSDVPIWLSTAGMGVSWLHVRLDARPKYYGYVPYKQAT